jgi:hypothetical protein
METSPKNRSTMKAIWWSLAIVSVSAASAIALPFTTYALTLATFGIAHVAIELRYINSRFHRQFGDRIEIKLVRLVLAIASLRIGSIAGIIPSQIAYLLELGCGLGLITIASYRLWTIDRLRGSIGLGLGCLLGMGISYDPIATSTIFAIFHNLTPVGFILERQGVKMRHVPIICGAIFGLMPLAILWYKSFPIVRLPLERDTSYLSAFIAPAWQQFSIAQPLFAAVVFLQCMHYATVIGLFSQWTPTLTETRSTWLSAKYFYLLLAGISLGFFMAFQHSFVLTRAYYGIIASIHAWIEIPLLLLLLQPHDRQPQTIGAQISTEG